MKIIKISILSFFCFTILFSFSNCGEGHSATDGHQHDTSETTEHNEDDDHGHEEEGEHEEGEIHLTKDQIKTVGISFGKLSSIKINDYIKATGTLGLPPQSYASVSAKAEGFIKNSNKYVEGSYVKKGTIMAYLENPDFIQQQQAYLEVSAELTFLQQELERQKALVDANAGVLKNVQKLESQVKMKNATVKGIAKQLAYIGIKVANLSADNIVEQIPIIAPMSGYVTSIDMHNGMYVTPRQTLMDIVSEKHLHLELDVFEKDIAHLKEEQKISYTVPALGDKVYEGEVHIIGKEFNTENKTVRIHGHLEKIKPKFIKDLFVDAKIWLNDQTVQALPEKAIIKDGASSYIYVANSQQDTDEIKFEKIMVIPGPSDKGFVSLKLVNPIPEGMQIVTKGAYYVYAQSKAGELEHEH
ncbi:MAG TPA: efflux RND transporter periplasmic adaptor subunit [Saprospiraceae bacterium]|nr:efflux RND transporter periplasmic adaptor subunit [Saprospiraceae bacterium]